ncbi:MAG TPA: aldolase/citrate lyase family protein [Geminicoccaceae bacterium]|nr:aldolase/citrate lyase family protein [Geminicoccaceae bacterium]
MYRPNVLKTQLKAGESVYGAWVGGGSPGNAELLGHVGFDFLVLDQEHGAGELSHAVEALRAVASSGTPCVVRAPWNDPIWLKRILDAGADSVMIPAVETAAAAKAAVAACRYPPQGTRGYAAGVVRASTFGLEPGYVAKANGNLLIVLQIESAAAVENAAEICAVEGVDVVFIGVNDLAGSIGRLEQLDHPDVLSLVRRAEEIIIASGKPMGTVPSAGASWQELFARGYRMVVGPHDVILLRDAALAALREYQSLRGTGGARSADATGRQGSTSGQSY